MTHSPTHSPRSSLTVLAAVLACPICPITAITACLITQPVLACPITHPVTQVQGTGTAGGGRGDDAKSTDAKSTDVKSADVKSADAPAAGKAAQPGATLGGYRLPLLREGSAIGRVTGDLTQDPDEKLWLFRPTEPEAGGLRREFALLPSPVLEDMLRTVRASGATVQFEMTGRVFIYRGRNFLLPDFAPSIMRFDARPGETPKAIEGTTKPVTVTTAPNGEDRFVAPAAGSTAKDDAVVDEIERRLKERVGRAPQARTGESRSGGAGGSARGAADAPIANGTRITQRLGRLSRDPQAGSWRFVPEQSTGSGDPSIEILPCLMLERLENTARESDAAPAILLSGTVYAFEGRSYLLPSSFRRAREGRGIGG